ncbi:MAG: NAD(P)/FAD-dependent oxidoreductase [Candidatus Omnitrophica bacterium]|nr:NAD(P)/FAD-dependent oxidoreductase [Candidatus Omnitrophota bacterium]MDD5080769.1 NAD(P)/FAD-dependent oxidoreductase [Candidatus Omnitrophota bacterium]MDD5440901.1 NAD(P)/FAD-dependent oxidoreductase [Candidatus Omnitrophota bacterium]
MDNKYDIMIIGCGPAGVTCAKEAVRHNLKVLMTVDDVSAVGGICLNSGCIPTKFMLKNAGRMSWPSLISEKNEFITKLREPVILFLRKIGVDIVVGKGVVSGPNEVTIADQKFNGNNIVIAVGSSPVKIFNDEKVIVSENFLNTESLGKRILIVGGGYIGIEFACMLNKAFYDVTVYEKEPSILVNFPVILTNRLKSLLVRSGIKIVTGREVSESDFSEFDNVITAIGRKPNTDRLGLDTLGIKMNKGWIVTDSRLRTNISNIYACGDVNAHCMLAYVADYHAKICVADILGKDIEENLNGIPECVFSIPQAASVGMSEEEAKNRGVHKKTYRIPFARFASAHIYNDLDGFAYIIEGIDGKLLGGGILSNEAAELISILSVAVRAGLTVEKFKNNFFVHPTLSEGLTDITD